MTTLLIEDTLPAKAGPGSTWEGSFIVRHPSTRRVISKATNSTYECSSASDLRDFCRKLEKIGAIQMVPFKPKPKAKDV